VVNQTTFRQLLNGRFSPNLAQNVVRCPVAESGDIFENFYFRGHLPQKTEIEKRSNRHLTQSRLQVTGCTAERYCLLRVVVQGPGSFRDPVNFYLRHSVAELQGVKVAQYSDFGLIFPYKTPKTYLPAYSPGVTSQNDYDFSM